MLAPVHFFISLCLFQSVCLSLSGLPPPHYNYTLSPLGLTVFVFVFLTF